MTATRNGQASAQAPAPIGMPAGVSRPARAPDGAPPRCGVSVAAWPVSCGLLAGFTASAVVTALTVVFGGNRHLAVALAVFAVAAALVSMYTRPLAAPGVALLAWMFDDGFLIHRHAALTWPGSAGAWRLALLAGVAIAGAAFGAWIRSHPQARHTENDRHAAH